MQGHEDYIEFVSRNLPELAKTRDLIRVGIYRSDQAAAAARREGRSPDFFKLNQRVIVYPKSGVLKFLRSKIA